MVMVEASICAPTTKGPHPRGKVLSGWDRHRCQTKWCQKPLRMIIDRSLGVVLPHMGPGCSSGAFRDSEAALPHQVRLDISCRFLHSECVAYVRPDVLPLDASASLMPVCRQMTAFAGRHIGIYRQSGPGDLASTVRRSPSPPPTYPMSVSDVRYSEAFVMLIGVVLSRGAHGNSSKQRNHMINYAPTRSSGHQRLTHGVWTCAAHRRRWPIPENPPECLSFEGRNFELRG